MQRGRRQLSLSVVLALVGSIVVLPFASTAGAQGDPQMTIRAGAAAPQPNLPISEVAPPNTPLPGFLINLINDGTSAPGDTVTLRGGGWPAGEPMVAEIFEAEAVGDIGAVMTTDSFVVNENGGFDVQALIPNMLRGIGGSDFYVLPGQYVIKLHTVNATNSASAPFTVGPPREGGSMIWGNVGLDLTRNATPDNPEVAGAAALGLGVGVSAIGPTTVDVVTDARGFYMLRLPAGIYSLIADTSFGGANWSTSVDVAADSLKALDVPLILEPGAF